MKTKVLIIGAGPSGSMAGYRMAQKGFTDFIIIDKEEFPRIKPCAGGLAPASVKFMKKVGIDHLLHETKPSAPMKSMRFIGPKGQEGIVETNLKSLTIPRRIYDKALLDLALSSGGEFIPGFNVTDLLTDEEGNITGATDGHRKVEAQAVIMANGGHNKNMREKYFPDKRPLRLMQSRIGWWKDFEIPHGRMEMVFDKDLLPHYGWVFPEGDGVVNIGICVYQDKLNGKGIVQTFDDFLDKYYKDRISRATIIGRKYSFPINVSSRVKDVVGRRMLLCGEAGRMCNPATAEGISFAMESGYMAGDIMADAFSSGILNESRLYDYEKKCASAFNTRLMMSGVVSSIIDSFLVNSLIKLGSYEAVKSFISAFMLK